MDVYLDKTVLQTAIREYTHENSLEITEFVCNDACAKGNNFLSDVKKITVRGKTNANSDYEISVIAKVRLKNDPRSEACNAGIAFKNEALAYSVILEEMKKWKPIAVPNFLQVRDDLIVIEDLGRKNYKTIPKSQRLSFDEIKSVLSVLAEFHSTSILMQQKDTNALLELTKHIQHPLYSKTPAPVITTQENQIKFTYELLIREKPKTQKILKAIAIFKNWINGNSTQLIKHLIFSQRNLKVINHGDLWLNNMLFNENRVKLIDFQCLTLTSLAVDLSYFLYVNLKADVLLEKMEELLELYLECLIREVGTESVFPGFDLNIKWLKEEMRDFFVFGVANALWLLPLFYFGDEVLEEAGDGFESDVESLLMVCPDSYKKLIVENVLKYVEVLENVLEK